ncbi:hypothetical protein N7450_011499 [Penicillium hetheringtonii]|uniref:Sulfatase N-terminal domain-containing protein n=1 Tax=Penicillium hetheringtonii TaxID=911720 RepID=A0AAD6GLX6_9EURO|nr:hypothetical protein N7450_011499 [Penicillium hetheringtonii]
MTDEQDLIMDAIDYQPALQRYMQDEGVFFSRHFCSVSLCCPSRISLLTGQATHNTNVAALWLPGFVKSGLDERNLPVYLQPTGYDTYYTGKLINTNSTNKYNVPYFAGWNGSDYPGTYIHYNCIAQRNRGLPVSNPGICSTDPIAFKALGFLKEAASSNAPFSLGITPTGSHGEIIPGGSGVGFYAPVPAERHKQAKIPSTPFLILIQSQARLNETAVAYNDEFYRKRLQVLQAFHDLVDNDFDWLHDHLDILKNTYVIYTSDNGIHLRKHCLPSTKDLQH